MSAQPEQQQPISLEELSGHSLMLIQFVSNEESRTFLDARSPYDLMELLIRMFENYLLQKLLNLFSKSDSTISPPSKKTSYKCTSKFYHSQCRLRAERHLRFHRSIIRFINDGVQLEGGWVYEPWEDMDQGYGACVSEEAFHWERFRVIDKRDFSSFRIKCVKQGYIYIKGLLFRLASRSTMMQQTNYLQSSKREWFLIFQIYLVGSFILQQNKLLLSQCTHNNFPKILKIPITHILLLELFQLHI